MTDHRQSGRGPVDNRVSARSDGTFGSRRVFRTVLRSLVGIDTRFTCVHTGLLLWTVPRVKPFASSLSLSTREGGLRTAQRRTYYDPVPPKNKRTKEKLIYIKKLRFFNHLPTEPHLRGSPYVTVGKQFCDVHIWHAGTLG